jgi:hypothetical protein
LVRGLQKLGVGRAVYGQQKIAAVKSVASSDDLLAMVPRTQTTAQLRHTAVGDRVSFEVPQIATYLPLIKKLRIPILPGDIQNKRFLLGREGKLSVYYVPFGSPNRKARVVLVGLAPGWTQTQIAYELWSDALRRGLSERQAFKAAMGAAAFAGMRKRICRWLDDLGVDKWLGLDTTENLFDQRRDLVHTTSLIRYPVFVGPEGKNYTGQNPAPGASPLLSAIIGKVLVPELKRIPDALIVPMGRAVGTSLQKVGIDADRCLFGFPHPSGLNGHGPRQFAEERRAMRRVVASLPPQL